MFSNQLIFYLQGGLQEKDTKCSTGESFITVYFSYIESDASSSDSLPEQR